MKSKILEEINEEIKELEEKIKTENNEFEEAKKEIINYIK